MKNKKIFAGIITTILLFVDFLMFHDINELHTTRDWLTLIVSVLIFYYFYIEFSKNKK